MMGLKYPLGRIGSGDRGFDLVVHPLHDVGRE
jgi:hypothetical protein